MSDARNSSVESRNCQRHCRQNEQTLVGDACLDQGMHTRRPHKTVTDIARIVKETLNALDNKKC
jgi:hypothetical protein